MLPREKDDTDTMAALREGLALGYNEFEVHASLGGDTGHTVANIQTLAFLHDHGARGVLHGQGQEASLVFDTDGGRAFRTAPGMRVSVFAWAGDAHGVVLRGLFWELDGGTLSASFPLGMSNRALGDEATVAVAEGALLVVVG